MSEIRCPWCNAIAYIDTNTVDSAVPVGDDVHTITVTVSGVCDNPDTSADPTDEARDAPRACGCEYAGVDMHSRPVYR